MKKKNKNKIRLSSDDYPRVLLSEIQPYHVPIIFDNYGFYKIVKKTNRFENDDVPKLVREVFTKDIKYSIPFNYKIAKNIHSSRQLSLIHPFGQLKFVDFYQEFYALILYYCTKSEFSLRYPTKINSTVFKAKNSNVYDSLTDNKRLENKYEQDIPDLDIDDTQLEFASTFFAYKKYDFNHKFYESDEFIRLEKRFIYLKMLDVSKCFDSIYTHSISWAIKDKDYIKKTLNHKSNGFEERFDSLMQSVNYSETNGIVIGAEVSRIFAELIFQQIDENIKQALKAEPHNLTHNRDYAIRRYVDDYSIFTAHKDVEEIVSLAVSNALSEYNLSTNPIKTKNYQRPFITSRSRNITELREYIKHRMSQLLVKNIASETNKPYYLPNNRLLMRPTTQATLFIKDIKSYWHSEDNFEAGFSSYLLNSLLVQILTFIKNYPKIPENIDKNQTIIVNFLIFIFDIAVYAFTLEPNVSQSFTFCRIIVVINQFLSKNSELAQYKEKFTHRVFDGLNRLLQNELSSESSCQIERLNILLVIHDINSEYLLNVKQLEQYLFGKDNQDCNYFSLITALFLIRNNQKYTEPKQQVVNLIKKKLEELPSIKISSEALHLYLDVMSCPFITEQTKLEISKQIQTKLGVSQNNVSSNAKEYTDYFSKHVWFVTWNSIDILNYLRRKQLRKAY